MDEDEIPREELLEYLIKNHESAIRKVLAESNHNIYYDFYINVIRFYDSFPDLGAYFYHNPLYLMKIIGDIVVDAQKIIKSEDLLVEARPRCIVKELIQVRFEGVPLIPEIYRGSISSLDVTDIDRFIVVNATVIRVANRKSSEKSKIFKCLGCQTSVRCYADHVNMNKITVPPKCTNVVMKTKKANPFWDMISKFKKKGEKGEESNPQPKQSSSKQYEAMCGGSKMEPTPDSQIFIDYQEIKIQESFRTIKPGNIPRTVWVILEGNLVDKCSPGDDIKLSGVLIKRWKKAQNGSRPDVSWCILANDIHIENKEKSMNKKSDMMSMGNSMTYEEEFDIYWLDRDHSLENELGSRNFLIESICPQLFEKYEIKLALLLCLIGGVALQKDGTRIRGLCHMLLVGEPGTGKSQLLKYASNLSARSVFTNGIGSTAAGLTISCIKEAGEWMFEAGALVLADMGVCCIDEFNLLQRTDLVSVHEAMEQQTISVSKAGLNCTAYTRATMIASCNPILQGQKYNRELDLTQNTGLATPLLSRFDLIFVVVDEVDVEKDDKNCEFILSKFLKIDESKSEEKEKKSHWDMEILREYIKYVTSNFEPTICEDAEKVLQGYYSYCRSQDLSGRSTIRLFESLIRLCQAHSRMMFREQATLFDAISVIILMESAFSTGLVPNVSFKDLIIITDSEQYKEIEKIILNKLKVLPQLRKPTYFEDLKNFVGHEDEQESF